MLAQRISTSLRIARKPRWFPEHWRLHSAPARRLSRRPTGMPGRFLPTDAAYSFLSTIPDAIAKAAIRLLDNDAERHTMRKRAYLHSRGTTWQKTAQAYMACFQQARMERMLRPRATLHDHLRTQGDGHVAHARHIPFIEHDRRHRHVAACHLSRLPNCLEGYTTDDNARALVVTIFAEPIRSASKPRIPGLVASLSGLSLVCFS